jgi:hypothetical protein
MTTHLFQPQPLPRPLGPQRHGVGRRRHQRLWRPHAEAGAAEEEGAEGGGGGAAGGQLLLGLVQQRNEDLVLVQVGRCVLVGVYEFELASMSLNWQRVESLLSGKQHPRLFLTHQLPGKVVADLIRLKQPHHVIPPGKPHVRRHRGRERAQLRARRAVAERQLGAEEAGGRRGRPVVGGGEVGVVVWAGVEELVG